MRADHFTAVAHCWLDDESQQAVDEFNRKAYWGDTFPRPIEYVLPMTMQSLVVAIPDLRVYKANAWLMSRGRDGLIHYEDRPLHGCCLGYEDSGFIWVDANDPPDERRFTVAHEVGHLMLDHFLPRQRAIARFGPTIVDVMDGRRPATFAEKFRSVLINIPIGSTINLMERRSRGQDALDLYRSEHRADRIALALLAPPDCVLRDALELRTPSAQKLATLLMEKYGLPPSAAHDYSHALIRHVVRPATPYDRLARK